jgi:tetratricopeptide (TPR) repeat protein
MSEEDDGGKSFRILKSQEESRRFIDNSFAIADQLSSEGRYRQSAELLEQIIASEPNHIEATNHLGWLYAFWLPDHRPEEAVSLFRRALEVAPSFGAARFNLACALKNMGRYEEALQELRTLVEDVFQGPYPEAWYELAHCLELTGQYEPAAEAYETSYRQETDPELMEECVLGINRCQAKKRYFTGGRKPPGARRGVSRRR